MIRCHFHLLTYSKKCNLLLCFITFMRRAQVRDCRIFLALSFSDSTVDITIMLVSTLFECHTLLDLEFEIHPKVVAEIMPIMIII